MDLSTTVLLALVVILALNQAMARIEAVLLHQLPYYSVQAINVGLGAGILAFGLPGWDHAPAVRFVVGPLFLVHVATNARRRSTVRRERGRRAGADEVKASKERIARALQKGEGSSQDS